MFLCLRVFKSQLIHGDDHIGVYVVSPVEIGFVPVTLTGQAAKTPIAADDELARSILAKLFEDVFSQRDHLSKIGGVVTGRLPLESFPALDFERSLRVFVLNFKNSRSVIRRTSALHRSRAFRQYVSAV